MRRALMAGLILAMVVAGGITSSPALATQCTGTIYGPKPVTTAITVPSGVTCNLQGIHVGGPVRVLPGGRLIIGGTSRIDGDVTANQAGSDSDDPFQIGPFSVMICNTHVGGSVAIGKSTARVVVGGGPCGGNAIDGGVTLTNNTGGVELVGNAPQAVSGACPIQKPPAQDGLGIPCGIGGSVAVNNSTGSVNPPYSGTFSAAVGYDVIGGDLACKNNLNGVTDITSSSDSNTVAGTRSGQCISL